MAEAALSRGMVQHNAGVTLSSPSQSNPKDESNSSWDDLFSSCGFNEDDLRETLQAEREVMGSSLHHHRSTKQDSSAHWKHYKTSTSTRGGGEGGGDSTSQASAAALKGLKEALESLSVERKQAYQEALAKNPRVVELESPPHRFLQNSQYNFWKCAEQISDYWTQRKEVYGEDRFWKPLTLWHVEKGESAMSLEAFRVIQQSKVAIAPNPDAFGRQVCVADHNQWNPHASGDRASTHRQGVFYMFQAISESELARSNGCVFVVAPARAESDPQEKSNVGDYINRLQQKRGSVSVTKMLQSGIFPTPVRAAHLLVPPSSSTFTRFYANVWLSLANQWNFLSFRARAHHVEEADEHTDDENENPEPVAIRTLREYGLGVEHLPTRFGGTADGEAFFRHRLEVERERYAPTPVTVPPALALSQQSKKDTSRNAKESPLTEAKEEPEERKMEDFQQWAKGHLEQLEVMRLESQIQNQREEQRDLKRLGDYLEARLDCVRHVELQYCQDLQFIRQRLEEFVAPLFEQDVNAAPLPSPTRSSMVDEILQKHLNFRGRLPSCGLWTFDPGAESSTPLGSPSSTVEQQALWSSVQHFLLLEQQVLLNDEKELFKLGPSKDFSWRDRDHEGDPDELEINRQIRDLEKMRNHLQKQKTAFQEQNKYFVSSLHCAEFLSESYNNYKDQHREVIANGFFQVLSTVPWMMRDRSGQALPLMANGEDDRTALREYAQSLVDRCFDLFSVFDEQLHCFCNPAVLVSQSIAEFKSENNQTPLLSSIAAATDATNASSSEGVDSEELEEIGRRRQYDQDCNFLRDILISILANPNESESQSTQQSKKSSETSTVLAVQNPLQSSQSPNNAHVRKKRSRDEAMTRRHRLKRKKMLQRL